jgi:hypothetical protein
MDDTNSVKIPVVCICGLKQMDDLMHNFDLFERFKALAGVSQIEVHRTSEPTPEQLATLVKTMKDSLEKTGYRVVAVFSPGRKEGAWKDDTVKCISDGKKWGMLAPVLSAYGWPE